MALKEKIRIQDLELKVEKLERIVELLTKRNQELDNRVKQLEEDRDDDIRMSADVHSY